METTSKHSSHKQRSQKSGVTENDDLTPVNVKETGLVATDLTSFQRKKSFDIHNDDDNELIDNDEFLLLEQQMKEQEQLNLEETKSRRSET